MADRAFGSDFADFMRSDSAVVDPRPPEDESLLDETAAVPPAFAAFLRSESDPEYAIQQGVKKDPDAHAENLALAESTGLPVETVELNRDELKQNETARSLDLSRHPHTSRWMADPDNAAIAIDDTPALKKIEDATSDDAFWQNYLSDLGIGVFAGSMNLFEMLKGSADFWTGGWLEHGIDKAGLGGQTELGEKAKEFYTRGMREAKGEVDAAKGFVGKTKAYIEHPRAALGDITESLPMMAAIALSAKAYATQLLRKEGLTAGTEAGSAFLRRPDTIKKVAMASGVSEGVLVQGSVYQEATEGGAPRLEAGLTSIAAGLSTAFISQQLSKILPDVEATAALSSLAKGAKTKGIIESGKAVGKSVLKEAPEETFQEGQEQFWINAATGRPLMEGVPEAAASGLVVGAGTGAAVSTVTEVVGALKASDRYAEDVLGAVIEQEQIDNLIAGAMETKTLGRSSERFDGFMQSLGEDRMVYITQDAAAQLKDPPDYIAEKLDGSGTDIAIPLKRFVADLATDESIMAVLRPHVRLSEAGLTRDEIETGDIPSLKKLLAQAEKHADIKTESDAIFETVVEQLIATGRMNEAMARTSASIIPAYITTHVAKIRAAGHEITVAQAYQDFFKGEGIRIAGPEVKPGDDPGTIMDQPDEPAYAPGQDFGDIEVESLVQVSETGKTQKMIRKAQDVWDEAQDRRSNLKQLVECLGA